MIAKFIAESWPSPHSWPTGASAAVQPPAGHPADQRHTGRRERARAVRHHRRRRALPAYFQLLVKALVLPGLQSWNTPCPRTWCCAHGTRVVPPSSSAVTFHRLTAGGYHSPMLDGVGHVPMFEAPGRITVLITSFIEELLPTCPGQLAGASRHQNRPFRHGGRFATLLTIDQLLFPGWQSRRGIPRYSASPAPDR